MKGCAFAEVKFRQFICVTVQVVEDSTAFEVEFSQTIAVRGG